MCYFIIQHTEYKNKVREEYHTYSIELWQILLIIISFIIHWFMALVTIIFFLICYILMLSDQIYVRFKSNKVSLLIYKIYKLLRKKII